MSLALYRGLTALATPLIHVYLARRRAQGKEDPARFEERRGRATRPRPSGPLIWLHGASVGEAMSVLTLIERLRGERPALSVMLTTGTVTSAALVAERLPTGAFHQYVPVDRPVWVRRFLDHWRPDLALWVESELWPNLVDEVHRRRVPMVLLNGRMSAGSYRRWRRLPGIIAPLLGRFALCLTQDDDQVAHFAGLGAPVVRCVGNLKCASGPLPVDAAALTALHTAVDDRPLWLAASTHDGEETMAADVHRRLAGHRRLLTIIVPRHATRGPAIAAALGAQGLRVARRGAGEPLDATTEVYVADTIGELGLFYRLAEIAFVGGSLVPHGGHNPLEPAQLDWPMRRPWPRRWTGCWATRPHCGGRPWPPRAWPARAGTWSMRCWRSWHRFSTAWPKRRRRRRSRVVRSPEFWDRDGLAPSLLAPVGWTWAAAGRVRRAWVRPVHAPRPVICIGNLVIGGAGKTPVALSIGAALRRRGRQVHFLTRGYGGRAAGPVRVDPLRHDVREVGDEALLLAALAPTWVAPDRVAGARAAAAAGAEVLVMDDGFQNPAIASAPTRWRCSAPTRPASVPRWHGGDRCCAAAWCRARRRRR
jgi:3-deoxy-D-manno-octulosonic-acid transferase